MDDDGRPQAGPPSLLGMSSRPTAGVRFTLAGGTRFVRRGRDQLQVGLVPGRCVVVPETVEHRVVLNALRTGDLPPETPEAAEILPGLAARGLLRVAGPQPRPPLEVTVQGDLGVDPAPLLAASGLRVARPAPGRPVLLLSSAEADRNRLDTLLRDGTPHLLVRVVDGGPVLGPLVVPGETACVRCIDAHRGDDDPAHRAVLERYLAAKPPPGGDPPLPAALATLLTCWAAHDLEAHLTGSRPTTWSTTLAWDPGFVDLTATTWCRHPSCGCCWDASVAPSGRIGA